MFKMEHAFQMGLEKATKCSTSFPQTRRGTRNCCKSHLWMGHSLEGCECIIWGSNQFGCKFAEVHWESVFCVGQEPSAISLDAIYIKSSLGRPLLAHCNWFRHVWYDRGPCPTPYYNDKHEQVRFILNTINFKFPILYYFQFALFQLLVLCTCIEIEVFFQFCFNPMFIKFDNVKPSLVHDFFHIQNIKMIPLVQFKDVIFLDVYKRCENKSEKMWYSLTQKSFFYYMYKVWFLADFSIWICQLFSLRHVSYKNISSWCNVRVFAHYNNLVWTS